MPRRKKPKIAPTAVQRVAAYRARIVAEGGRQIAIMLRAPAVAKLDKWVERGETMTDLINRLLIRSKP